MIDMKDYYKRNQSLKIPEIYLIEQISFHFFPNMSAIIFLNVFKELEI